MHHKGGDLFCLYGVLRKSLNKQGLDDQTKITTKSSPFIKYKKKKKNIFYVSSEEQFGR